MTETSPDRLLEAVLRNQERELERYRILLAPLFDPKGINIFHFACALIRVGGMQSAGWDPLEESIQTLDDLIKLVQLDLEPGRFTDPLKTRWRLFLISYAHLVEMDAPYDVLANLLRVRLQLPSTYNPFREFIAPQPKSRKKQAKPRPLSTPALSLSPAQKISAIKQLATRAGCQAIGELFDDFYFSSLRNAIDHSDYVLHGSEFRIRNGVIPEEDNPHSLTPVISLDRLSRIIERAYGFYSALFSLEHNARAWFAGFKGQGLPSDLALKGLLEFLIDDQGLLCGFKMHWPNAHDSVYRRLPSGCDAMNIFNQPDGTVDFFVGEYFREHHPFSRLVPADGQPRYTTAEGASEPLQWPSNSAGVPRL